MIDVKANALRMVAEGMPRFMVAAKSGTTEAQIREWEQEAAQDPVLAMLHEGKTPRRSARRSAATRRLPAHLSPTHGRRTRQNTTCARFGVRLKGTGNEPFCRGRYL